MSMESSLGIVLQYVGGGQYMMAVPARDLTRVDLIDVEEREGITLEQIMASGLYVEMEDVEVAPFCGAATDGGNTRCRVPVEIWGARCEEHGG